MCLLDSWDLLGSFGFCKELLEEHGKSPDAMASSKYAPGTKFLPLGCTDVHCAFTLFLYILYSPTYALQEVSVSFEMPNLEMGTDKILCGAGMLAVHESHEN